jgi:hypothetical protein
MFVCRSLPATTHPNMTESGFGKAIAGVGSVGDDSANSRMVEDFGIPSLQADPYDDNGYDG